MSQLMKICFQILRTYRERGGEPRRGANGQRGRRGTHHRRNKLVGIVSAYAQAAASGFQSYELGGADARLRDVAGPHGGRTGTVS